MVFKNVSVKSIPYFYRKPLTTQRALYFSTSLLAPILVLKTYHPFSAFQLGGKSTSFHVFCAAKSIISFSIASIYCFILGPFYNSLKVIGSCDLGLLIEIYILINLSSKESKFGLALKFCG